MCRSERRAGYLHECCVRRYDRCFLSSYDDFFFFKQKTAYEILKASLFSSPFTVSAGPVNGTSDRPSGVGITGFGITKFPSKKNFSAVMQAPPTVPWPVG